MVIKCHYCLIIVIIIIAALEAVSKRLETGDYHKDAIAAEKSFVGNSKDLKEGVQEVKKKE